jgi:hypothetical protein
LEDWGGESNGDEILDSCNRSSHDVARPDLITATSFLWASLFAGGVDKAYRTTTAVSDIEFGDSLEELDIE